MNSTQINFRADDDTKSKISYLSEIYDMKTSDVIRDAIKFYFEVKLTKEEMLSDFHKENKAYIEGYMKALLKDL